MVRGGFGGYCGLWCGKRRKREKMKKKLVLPFWVYSEISLRKWNFLRNYLRARGSEKWKSGIINST